MIFAQKCPQEARNAVSANASVAPQNTARSCYAAAAVWPSRAPILGRTPSPTDRPTILPPQLCPRSPWPDGTYAR